jgi:hypothetical protein
MWLCYYTHLRAVVVSPFLTVEWRRVVMNWMNCREMKEMKGIQRSPKRRRLLRRRPLRLKRLQVARQHAHLQSLASQSMRRLNRQQINKQC